MALDFTVLCPKIERIIDEIEQAYQNTQGLILTEDDLKCILYKKLTTLQELRRPVPTQDEHILASYVHAEVSWYGENRTIAIKPDITILEPEHLSILHGYVPLLPPRRIANPSRSIINPFIGMGSTSLNFDRAPRLPSKQFGFGGKAITFELKFARQGITERMLRLIKEDYDQILRLFRLLDSRGEGDTIFSYMVIFNKYQQNLNAGAFAGFFRNNESSHRHKIIYKTGNVARRPL
ncbi:MAG TPA: hypothetical protein VF131_11115 [Blastocatellia bacterium]|nr:hypothetical protein [Blastocatellia bacterium]